MHYILLSDPEMYVGGSWQDFTGWKVNVQELLTICLFMILWWEDRLIKSTILPPFQLLLIYAATRRERLKPWIITLWCSTLTIPKERTISCIQSLFFFFFIYVECPGQLTRTTTILYGPLDILQAQEQVRHRRGDRRAHRESNPEWERNK